MTIAEKQPTLFGKVGQVAVVVSDLDAAMARYLTRLGIGPWRVYTFAPPRVKRITLRGKPAEFAMRVAFASVGDVIWELIEPLSGESLYTEFLRAHGEGLHHVGVYVADLDAELAKAEQSGYSVLQSGRDYGADGDGGFAYLSTDVDTGAIIELIQVPRNRLPPDFVYPAQ